MELHYVRMTANRPLCGEYGKPDAGENFTTDNRTAESLEMRGLARRYQPPRPKKLELPWAWQHVQQKMQAPPENKMIAVEQNKVATSAPEPPAVPERPRLLKRRGRPPGAKNRV
jgi:hypothetical protein